MANGVRGRTRAEVIDGLKDAECVRGRHPEQGDCYVCRDRPSQSRFALPRKVVVKYWDRHDLVFNLLGGSGSRRARNRISPEANG